MTEAQLFALSATIWIAPHIPKPIAITAGFFLMALSFWVKA